MILEFKIKRHPQFLEVIVTGTYDFDRAIKKIPGVLSLCRTTGITKLLLDFRAVTRTMEVAHKILYSREIRDLYCLYILSGGKDLSLAYLVKPEQVTEYEPGLHLARQNNLPFQLFGNIQKAYDWLGLMPPIDSLSPQP